MTNEELQLIADVAQICIGEPGFSAFVGGGDPMLLTIIVGGGYRGQFYTIDATVSRYEIEAMAGDARTNYINHVVKTIRESKAGVHSEVVRTYLESS